MLLVLEYIRKSETSPFKKMTAIFARKEYQKDKGNLSHSHLMIRLNWSLMSDIKTEFVNDLIRASICDIVRPDEVEKFVEEGCLQMCMIFTRFMSMLQLTYPIVAMIDALLSEQMDHSDAEKLIMYLQVPTIELISLFLYHNS